MGDTGPVQVRDLATRVELPLWEKITERAKQEDCSVSRIVRLALRAYFDDESRKAA